MSNPAPNSISGATVPFTDTLPFVGFSTPAITFNIVLFPLPFKPINPNASPRLILKLTSFKAQNSPYDNCRFIVLITYSLKLSTLSDARLKRIDT